MYEGLGGKAGARPDEEKCSIYVDQAAVDMKIWPPKERHQSYYDKVEGTRLVSSELLNGLKEASKSLREIRRTSSNESTTTPSERSAPSAINSKIDLEETDSTTTDGSDTRDSGGVEWVTLQTACNHGLNRLAEVVSNSGIPFTVLGLGQTWRGFGNRMRLYHDYLLRVPSDRLVILSDAEDVLLVPRCTAKELLEGFWSKEAATSRLLVSAERACYPDFDRAPEYAGPEVLMRPGGVRDPRDLGPLRLVASGASRGEFVAPHVVKPRDADAEQLLGDIAGSNGKNGKGSSGLHSSSAAGSVVTERLPPSSFKFLNAGTVVGLAGDLRWLLKSLYSGECMDDQRALTKAYLNPDVHWYEGDSGIATVKEIESAMVSYERAAATYGIGSPQYIQARQHLMKTTSKSSYQPVSKIRRVNKHDPIVESIDGTGYYSSGKISVPDHARPLMALDHDHDLMIAMYETFIDDYVVDRKTGSLLFKQTGGMPCILHQNGKKNENRVLEEVARELGLKFNARAIEDAKKRAKKMKGKSKPLV
ncbi:hypothetical protein HDU76_001767 [Blyttiomyces sp. JEL0837]|nr:hypothetical protein HDU76_001767 [Blyttiomyces sp. JEL0837]